MIIAWRRAVFASKRSLVLLMITTQAHRERSAHVAKEKQAEEQTDRTCNRPYWPLLTILPLRPIRIPRRFHHTTRPPSRMYHWLIPVGYHGHENVRTRGGLLSAADSDPILGPDGIPKLTSAR